MGEAFVETENQDTISKLKVYGASNASPYSIKARNAKCQLMPI